MDEKKVTFKDVSIALGAITLAFGVIGFYIAIKVEITEIRKDTAFMSQNMGEIKKSIDSLCSKYDSHEARINALDKDIAVMKSR